MAGKILERQSFIKNLAAELMGERTGAFLIGLCIQCPKDPAPQSCHRCRFQNDAVATRWKFMDLPPSFSLADRGQRPLLNLQVIDGSVSRRAPAGGIVGLDRQAEAGFGTFLVRKEFVTCRHAYGSDR